MFVPFFFKPFSFNLNSYFGWHFPIINNENISNAFHFGFFNVFFLSSLKTSEKNKSNAKERNRNQFRCLSMFYYVRNFVFNYAAMSVNKWHSFPCFFTCHFIEMLKFALTHWISCDKQFWITRCNRNPCLLKQNKRHFTSNRTIAFVFLCHIIYQIFWMFKFQFICVCFWNKQTNTTTKWQFLCSFGL